MFFEIRKSHFLTSQWLNNYKMQALLLLQRKVYII